MARPSLQRIHERFCYFSKCCTVTSRVGGIPHSWLQNYWIGLIPWNLCRMIHLCWPPCICIYHHLFLICLIYLCLICLRLSHICYCPSPIWHPFLILCHLLCRWHPFLIHRCQQLSNLVNIHHYWANRVGSQMNQSQWKSQGCRYRILCQRCFKQNWSCYQATKTGTKAIKACFPCASLKQQCSNSNSNLQLQDLLGNQDNGRWSSTSMEIFY